MERNNTLRTFIKRDLYTMNRLRNQKVCTVIMKLIDINRCIVSDTCDMVNCSKVGVCRLCKYLLTVLDAIN